MCATSTKADISKEAHTALRALAHDDFAVVVNSGNGVVHVRPKELNPVVSVFHDGMHDSARNGILFTKYTKRA
eukprot:5278736-Pleurochrysis_carterae.AAC.1